MKEIKFTADEFDKLMEDIESVDMEKDDYIPSVDDVFDYIKKFPERYYMYLLWFSENKPEPTTEEEKQVLKKITKIINNTIVID